VLFVTSLFALLLAIGFLSKYFAPDFLYIVSLFLIYLNAEEPIVTKANKKLTKTVEIKIPERIQAIVIRRFVNS